MKVKTAELTGAALDWAVAYCEGLTNPLFSRHTAGQCWINVGPTGHDVFAPSTDWFQGGPIIERERIALWHGPTGWYATPTTATGYTGEDYYIDVTEDDGVFGPTPLVAAMRCFVASKLGAEVDVPEGLL